MKLRLPLLLVGCLIGVSAQADTWIPERHGNKGPLYSDAVLRGFQVLDVNLGMTLSEAAMALSKHGFKPVNKIVERRTAGSKKGGEDVTFRQGQDEITLTYSKLTDRPALVSGVFYWKPQADPTDGQSFSERANNFITRYGFPSRWELETSIENFSGGVFSWFSQESFKDDHVLKDTRACHADWQRSVTVKGLNCEEILRNASSGELSVILMGDTTLYMLNDYHATYESLRTNVEFMKQQRNVGIASGV